MYGNSNINLSHAVTMVRRAASRIEAPCLSVGSHSAAAFTVVFDHTSYLSQRVNYLSSSAYTYILYRKKYYRNPFIYSYVTEQTT